MKNEDDQCFKWCIARALNPIEKNSERIDKKLKLQAEELNWKGINFPVSWHDIDKFERCNVGLRLNEYMDTMENLQMGSATKKNKFIH